MPDGQVFVAIRLSIVNADSQLFGRTDGRGLLDLKLACIYTLWMGCFMATKFNDRELRVCVAFCIWCILHGAFGKKRTWEWQLQEDWNKWNTYYILKIFKIYFRKLENENGKHYILLLLKLWSIETLGLVTTLHKNWPNKSTRVVWKEKNVFVKL